MVEKVVKKPSEFNTYDALNLYITPSAYVIKPISNEPLQQSLSIDRRNYSVTFISTEPPFVPRDKTMTIYGILGVISLQTTDYVIAISSRAKIGRINGKDIYQALDFKVLPLDAGATTITANNQIVEQFLLKLLQSHLTTGKFYFSPSFDITSTLQSQTDKDLSIPIWKRANDQFFWNKFLQKKFIDEVTTDPTKDLHRYILPVIYGFCNIKTTSIGAQSLTLTLIARRSRYRAGTRYFSRGIDSKGFVSNFNETEQIISFTPISSEKLNGEQRFSYVQTRGSIPIYWAEINTLRYKPDLQIMEAAGNTLESLRLHLNCMIDTYGEVTLVNLINQSGYERPVKDAFEKSLRELNHPKIHYQYFDFHHECSKMRWDRLSILTDKLEPTLKSQQYYHTDASGQVKLKQTSIIRTNCMDCLDRTNVVQSTFAKYVLTEQLRKVGVLNSIARVDDYPAFMFTFRNVWADHADAISNTYSGTGALKTDYTRTGKRTRAGAFQDFLHSATRYIKSNFLDGARQDSFDLVQGNWKPSKSSLINPFQDIRPITVKYIPYVLAFCLTMLLCITTVFRSSSSNSRSHINILLILTLAILFYIISFGRDFVNWPRLVPISDALNYDGPGWKSGMNGRGLKLPFIKRASLVTKTRARLLTNRLMSDIEGQDKKRND